MSESADPQPATSTNAAATTGVDQAKPRVKVTISKETTYITEPLRPDGYPDYIRYIDEKLREGVTPENNAIVLLLKTFGPGLEQIPEGRLAEYAKKLGIGRLPAAGDYFVHWITYARKIVPKILLPVPPDIHLTAEAYFESLDAFAGRKPWTAQEFPPLAIWLDVNNQHIDRFVEASKRPRMYTPLLTGDMAPTLIAVLLPVAQNSRQAARALAARAMYRAGSGDVKGAVEDLMAIHRLARLIAHGFTLVEGLVGRAMEGIALDAEASLIAHNKLTRDQRAMLRKALGQLPSMQPMANALDLGERFMYLDSVCWIARTGPARMRQLTGFVDDSKPSGFDFAGDLVSGALIEWDVPLRVGNDWYDRYSAAARIMDAKQRLKALKEIAEDVDQTAVRAKGVSTVFGLFFSPRQAASQKMADVFIALLLPALNSALQAEYRTQTKRELVELGLALADYRDDHQQFPPKLDALSPKYIPKVSLDPMWGEPFVYKPTNEGCLLYGLGRNGQDDGGHMDENGGAADDLVVAVTATANR
jgi:hypothetical protein